jgi:hypothetical protein
MTVEQINNTTGTVLYLHHDQQGSTRGLSGLLCVVGVIGLTRARSHGAEHDGPAIRPTTDLDRW